MESTNIEVYKAVCAVQLALSKQGIAKDKQAQGYKFRGIDDIYNALSPLLAANNLCIIPRMLTRTYVERTSKSGGSLYFVCVHAEFDFVSAIDGSKHTASTFGEAMDSSDKATNKAMSAAYKYAAFQTFAIPTEGDNDADAHTPIAAPVDVLKALQDAAMGGAESLKAARIKVNADASHPVWLANKTELLAVAKKADAATNNEPQGAIA